MGYISHLNHHFSHIFKFLFSWNHMCLSTLVLLWLLKISKPIVVTHAYNSGTPEGKAGGGSALQRPALSISQSQDQYGEKVAGDIGSQTKTNAWKYLCKTPIAFSSFQAVPKILSVMLSVSHFLSNFLFSHFLTVTEWNWPDSAICFYLVISVDNWIYVFLQAKNFFIFFSLLTYLIHFAL